METITKAQHDKRIQLLGHMNPMSRKLWDAYLKLLVKEGYLLRAGE